MKLVYENEIVSMRHLKAKQASKFAANSRLCNVKCKISILQYTLHSGPLQLYHLDSGMQQSKRIYFISMMCQSVVVFFCILSENMVLVRFEIRIKLK